MKNAITGFEVVLRSDCEPASQSSPHQRTNKTYIFLQKSDALEFLKGEFEHKLKLNHEKNKEMEAGFNESEGRAFIHSHFDDHDTSDEWNIIEVEMPFNGNSVGFGEVPEGHRRLVVLMDVDDTRAQAENQGTCDYFEQECGWLADSGISVTAERILDPDDPEDAAAIAAIGAFIF